MSSLSIDRYEVQLELTEELLGTVPKNKEVYATFIASKGREMAEKAAKKGIPLANSQMPNEPAEDGSGDTVIEARVKEEVATIQEVEERGYTGFHSDAEGRFLYDYAIMGYMREAARTLKEIDTVKQLADKIRRYVILDRRRVRLPSDKMRIEEWNDADRPLLVLTDKGIVCERPLRAQTAQGPRVTVTRSDVILAGGKIEFGLKVLGGGSVSKKILAAVFEYGEFIGLGQWRSGGFGRFKVSKLEKLKV